MHWILVTALSIHVLTAVFWAGTTFAMARLSGRGSEILFAPQMAAAIISVLTGGYLWHTLHEGAFSLTEQILAFASICALAALAIQVWFGRPRSSMSGKGDGLAHTSRAQRLSAILLGLSVLGMAAAKYA